MRLSALEASAALHAAAILLLVFLPKPGPLPTVKLTTPTRLVLLPLYTPKLETGGGGNNHSLPASRGAIPRLRRPLLLPPTPAPPAEQPQLPLAAALPAPDNFDLAVQIVGLPTGLYGPPSAGPGRYGGIGSGDGPGAGPGNGNGPGIAASTALSAPTQPPIVLYKVEPEFSEEARKARFQGTVLVRVVIGEDGLPSRFQIIRPAGLGLDEKAIEAVSQWRFRPGMRNGKPVAVPADISLNFRLL